MKNAILLSVLYIIIGIGIVYAADNNKLFVVKATPDVLEVRLTNPECVSGAQFTIHFPSNVVLGSPEQGTRIAKEAGWVAVFSELGDSIINVLIINMRMDSLSPGEGVLVRIPYQLKKTYKGGQVRLEGVMLTNPKADSLGVEVIDLQLESESPGKIFVLGQNYPNPFNLYTVIRFNIYVPAQVKLVVFNSLGQEIATLVSEEKLRGSYEVPFSALNLSSGVYFYRLQANGFAETKMMVYLK